MRIAGQGVEKQIGMPVTSEMLCRRNDGSKHQPSGFVTALSGFEAQIVFDQIGGLEQPQNTAGYGAEQAHPDIENRRRYLVTVVETAEHQRTGRQSPILSRPGRARHLPLSVVDLVAAWKMNQSLREEWLLVLWDDKRIDDDVVDEIRPHGSGISEITHLHRGR